METGGSGVHFDTVLLLNIEYYQFSWKFKYIKCFLFFFSLKVQQRKSVGIEEHTKETQTSIR